MNDRIKHLFNKYKQKQLTDREQLEWEQFLDNEIERGAVEALFDEEWEQVNVNSIAETGSLQSNIDFILSFPQKARKTFFAKSFYWAAAAVLVSCALAMWVYLIQVEERVVPGTNRAYITLADGREVELSDNPDGIQLSNGKMQYADGSELQLPANELVEEQELTLVTPRGGQYKVKLSDGTIVFLNASSSLFYPASFTSKEERVVQLSGEAYFEVAKDVEKPFIVHTDHQKIRVLGTKFLVSNYTEEVLSKTTLLEGSVFLEGSAGQVLLRPNQQAVWSMGELLKVEDVEAIDEIAWVNGEFVLNDIVLKDILLKLARWYDVNIQYEQESLKGERYEGVISRFEQIDQVLSLLELANSKVRFKLNGRTIQVVENK